MSKVVFKSSRLLVSSFEHLFGVLAACLLRLPASPPNWQDMSDAGRQAYWWGRDLCGLATRIDSASLSVNVDVFAPLPLEPPPILGPGLYNDYASYALLAGFLVFFVVAVLLLVVHSSLVALLAHVVSLFVLSTRLPSSPCSRR